MNLRKLSSAAVIALFSLCALSCSDENNIPEQRSYTVKSYTTEISITSTTLTAPTLQSNEKVSIISSQNDNGESVSSLEIQSIKLHTSGQNVIITILNIPITSDGIIEQASETDVVIKNSNASSEELKMIIGKAKDILIAHDGEVINASFTIIYDADNDGTDDEFALDITPIAAP